MAFISSNFLTILIAVGAVALLVLGYSITYFFRGRHVQTDVGGNDEMKKRGLKCTTQQIREDEAALRGEPAPDYSSDCAGCAAPCSNEK